MRERLRGRSHRLQLSIIIPPTSEFFLNVTCQNNLSKSNNLLIKKNLIHQWNRSSKVALWILYKIVIFGQKLDFPKFNLEPVISRHISFIC